VATAGGADQNETINIGSHFYVIQQVVQFLWLKTSDAGCELVTANHL